MLSVQKIYLTKHYSFSMADALQQKRPSIKPPRMAFRRIVAFGKNTH